ncbi:ADP-heptose:LPS heptosyltransferase [Frankia sp. EI5c]|nr:ADP-heptose:LPS heptosyltransferase [Frankia sp. EI5c]
MVRVVRVARVARMSVLALRALGLGDLLTALPALRGLRAALPGRRIVLAAPRWLEPVALLSGAVDAVVDTAPLAVPAVRSAELAVNLHGRGPQSTAALRATAPRRLWAFDLPGGPRYDADAGAARDEVEGATGRAGREPARVPEHEVRRWCRLLAAHGVRCDPDDLALPRPNGVAAADPLLSAGPVVVHPGGASPARRWPAERWGAVVAALARCGRPVVVTGTAAEADLARRVARLGGLAPEAVRAGRTDLPGLCDLVAQAALLLAADTGIGHLATAYGTPSVLLFGPVSPAEWGPPPGRRAHRALWAGRDGDPSSTRPDPGLLSITVGDVLSAAVDRARPGGAVPPTHPTSA